MDICLKILIQHHNIYLQFFRSRRIADCIASFRGQVQNTFHFFQETESQQHFGRCRNILFWNLTLASHWNSPVSVRSWLDCGKTVRIGPLEIDLGKALELATKGRITKKDNFTFDKGFVFTHSVSPFCSNSTFVGSLWSPYGTPAVPRHDPPAAPQRVEREEREGDFNRGCNGGRRNFLALPAHLQSGDFELIQLTGDLIPKVVD